MMMMMMMNGDDDNDDDDDDDDDDDVHTYGSDLLVHEIAQDMSCGIAMGSTEDLVVLSSEAC
eukprot:12408144-Karenia_brevis.AAC.1